MQIIKGFCSNLAWYQLTQLTLVQSLANYNVAQWVAVSEILAFKISIKTVNKMLLVATECKADSIICTRKCNCYNFWLRQLKIAL